MLQIRRWKPTRYRLGAFAAATVLLLLIGGALLYAPAEAEPVSAISPFSFGRMLTAPTRDGLPEQFVPSAVLAAPLRPKTNSAARAARIGAFVAELQIMVDTRMHVTSAAYYTRDSTALDIVERYSRHTAVLAPLVAAELRHVPRGRAAARQFDELAARATRQATSSPGFRYARDDIPIVEPYAFTLASWLGVARIAAARGDRGYFLRPESGLVLSTSLERGGFRTGIRERLHRVSDLAHGEAIAAEWEALQPALDELLVELIR